MPRVRTLGITRRNKLSTIFYVHRKAYYSYFTFEFKPFQNISNSNNRHIFSCRAHRDIYELIGLIITHTLHPVLHQLHSLAAIVTKYPLPAMTKLSSDMPPIPSVFLSYEVKGIDRRKPILPTRKVILGDVRTRSELVSALRQGVSIPAVDAVSLTLTVEDRRHSPRCFHRRMKSHSYTLICVTPH